ncbi:MAG: hypothetical protein ACK4OM_04560 [Alphaproteobacteria bacterium]
MTVSESSSAITISESIYSPKHTYEEITFPIIKSYNENYLKVSDLHSIWFAEYGNPEGLPVLVIHGGPGAGASNNDMRYFDPKNYRIILFDQRGSNRSSPLAELNENTT